MRNSGRNATKARRKKKTDGNSPRKSQKKRGRPKKGAESGSGDSPSKSPKKRGRSKKSPIKKNVNNNRTAESPAKNNMAT